MTAESMSPIREDYIRQLTPYTAFLAALRAPGCPAATFDPGVNFDVARHDFREHVEKTLLHEIRTLCTLPPHPNIMPRPRILPVRARDSVDEQVLRANKANTRLPLGLRAKWCYQMALAIQHTHQVAGSYHMDLKPGNMLVDGDDNVRLIDWEQSGVSMFTHPPEVAIDQEAEESSILNNNKKKNKPRIIYTPHEGAPRKNQKWGFPDWNVFPEWKRTCPRAAELAEVFVDAAGAGGAVAGRGGVDGGVQRRAGGVEGHGDALHRAGPERPAGAG
uniref:Camk family protein kinase n=1 Tax=Colletotrichum fructicola (strain Nara gc5) TaxID=1213859 RepID=L2G659_COLFN